MQRVDLRSIWPVHRPVVGMVHLAALPGAPLWSGSLDRVIERALTDARALVDAGFDGLIVENFGDAPFHATRVPAATISAMTRVVCEIRRIAPVPLGVNVLRNDARAALSIAAATGAAFIRVNVHSGAMVTDQGWIDGEAAKTMRLRRNLGVRCAVFADVAVKHAALPPGVDIASAARDAWHRGLADALVVTGPGTGEPPGAGRLDVVRSAAPEAPVWIGSGVTVETASGLAGSADGVITGSATKFDGKAANAVDAARAARLIEVLRARSSGD